MMCIAVHFHGNALIALLQFSEEPSSVTDYTHTRSAGGRRSALVFRVAQDELLCDVPKR